jgi:ABC-2 type transport system ATP-binding protein
MIRVDGLVKRFGDVVAADGVTFEVDRGEVVGFLGPNGAGKSTTMRCLTGFLHADEGELEVAGTRVDPDRPETRACIGYLPESTPLYRRMRVRDYLDYVGRVRGLGRRARADALARVVSDCDLEGYLERRIETLSKGYRQRTGLAQALLGDPDVLVLDEPTSGLDPAEVARIRELVRRLGERKTVLLSTHVLSEVQAICARVVILAAGRVVADGPLHDLAQGGRDELRVLSGAGNAGLERALTGIPGVTAVRSLGVDDAGRAGFALHVEDRWTAAAAVSALAAAQGWTLLELGHERPSLERIFLERTEGAL